MTIRMLDGFKLIDKDTWFQILDGDVKQSWTTWAMSWIRLEHLVEEDKETAQRLWNKYIVHLSKEEIEELEWLIIEEIDPRSESYEVYEEEGSDGSYEVETDFEYSATPASDSSD